MTWTELRAQMIEAMKRLEWPSRLRAFALASASVECRIGPSGVSRLAHEYNNLFGIKYNEETDRGRYLSVSFPGNVFDQGDGLATVQYRRYNNIEHCLKNWLAQVFGSTYRDAAVETFVVECAKTWCVNNPEHADSVRDAYHHELKIEIG